jgi:ribosomal-protein-serine acetyltransferase
VRESIATLGPWMPWAHADYAEADALGWIGWCEQGWMERSGFEVGIFDAASGDFVGGCGLNQFDRAHDYCCLG